MPRLNATRLATPILAVAIVATATAGVTFASSASHGVKACENSKGVLVVASAKGRCPKHDSKVSLGKTGPKGATGPSNGYVATARTAVELSGPTTVVTLALPAGSYLLDGDANLDNFNTGSETPYCEITDGSTSTIAYQTPLAAKIGSGLLQLPGSGSDSVNGALTLTAAGSIQLVCAASSATTALGSLTAVRIGTLRASGDASFK
jgi:hypothetical protein